MGLHNIIIESDSKVALILILKTSREFHWSLTILLDNISQLCVNRNVKFCHIFREGNSIADHLSNVVVVVKSGKVYDPGDYQDKRGVAYLRKIRKKVLMLGDQLWRKSWCVQCGYHYSIGLMFYPSLLDQRIMRKLKGGY